MQSKPFFPLRISRAKTPSPCLRDDQKTRFRVKFLRDISNLQDPPITFGGTHAEIQGAWSLYHQQVTGVVTCQSLLPGDQLFSVPCEKITAKMNLQKSRVQNPSNVLHLKNFLQTMFTWSTHFSQVCA